MCKFGRICSHEYSFPAVIRSSVSSQPLNGRLPIFRQGLVAQIEPSTFSSLELIADGGEGGEYGRKNNEYLGIVPITCFMVHDSDILGWLAGCLQE